MTTTFTQFIQQKALEDKLPFGIDFEIAPNSSEVTTTVAGMEVPVYDELLTRESWFFEMLETLNGSKLSELQLVLRKLVRGLKKACDLESLEQASNYLFNPPSELVETEAYQTFNDANQSEIDSLLELSKLAQNTQAINWMRVTFFILSRVDGDWTFGKTAALRTSQINDIIAFIAKEANGGIEPANEPVEETEVEGKSGKDATGSKSTGK